MADVRLSQSSEDFVKDLGPVDRQTVAWAISLLEHDDTRQMRSIDLSLVEDGFALWAFVAGNVFLAFIESTDDEVTVVHISILSGFGHVRTG